MPSIASLEADILAEFPAYRVVNKFDSFLMKAINVALLVVTFGQLSSFMTQFVTTIGSTVYVPAGWETKDDVSRCVTLRHERVHMRQSQRLGTFWFRLLYLLAWFPMFFAWYRAKFEMEAYEETIRASHEYGADITDPQLRLRMIAHFTTAQYGWMWPMKNTIERWYDAAVVKVMGSNA